jgi:hypothetical protein
MEESRMISSEYDSGAEEAPPLEPAVQRAQAWAEAARQGLRRQIKLSPLRQGEVSRRLGMGEGYLANLFTTLQGRKPITLRLDLVLALLAILEIPPSRFFAELEAQGGWFGPAEEPAPVTLRRPVTEELSVAEYEEVGRNAVALARSLLSNLAPPASGRARRRRRAGEA